MFLETFQYVMFPNFRQTGKNGDESIFTAITKIPNFKKWCYSSIFTAYEETQFSKYFSNKYLRSHFSHKALFDNIGTYLVITREFIHLYLIKIFSNVLDVQNFSGQLWANIRKELFKLICYAVLKFFKADILQNTYKQFQQRYITLDISCALCFQLEYL